MRITVVVGGAVALAIATGAWLSTPPATYTKLDGAGEPLKEAFNRDSGKVRVLALVAPT